MEACTVTALDATTAFAVPDLGCSSQSPPIFSGPGTQQVTLPEPITQPTSDWLRLSCQPFRPSTLPILTQLRRESTPVIGASLMKTPAFCGRPIFTALRQLRRMAPIWDTICTEFCTASLGRSQNTASLLRIWGS